MSMMTNKLKPTKMNTKQLREMNITGEMTFSNELGIISIETSCGKKLIFDSSSDRMKAANKLRMIGVQFSTSGYADTEEFEGLCQAAQLGFKTFECTILSR